MPLFLYKARDASGKSVNGTMEAVSKDQLIEKLHNMGYMTTYAKETTIGPEIESVLDRFKGISEEDMILFYIQFANMMNSGLSIISCLDTLSRQIDNKKLRQTVGEVLRNIEAGDSLSEALLKYPKVFPFIFVSMIKVAEASGKLSGILSTYVAFAQAQLELRQKIRGAFFYPAILFTAAVAVILFIVTFIIPQFAQIFLKVGIKLPLLTMMLYNAGMAIKQYWYIFVIFSAGIFFALRFYIKTKHGRLNFDRFKLAMPLMGSLYRKTVISRFARTLGLLSSSGVGILQSLDITRGVVLNEVIANVISNVRGSVEKGEKIAAVIKISEEFPPDVYQMISIGEETGSLIGMLSKIADIYDIYVEYAVKKLTIIIEPLFMTIMGCIIGFIMASLLLPMFDMIKILRH